jgi:hypothetical protein
MTRPALSKTAALRAAQAACGRIIRRSSTDYVCYVPFYDTRPDGPSTELQASDYWKCRARRTHKVAHIALALMGIDDADYQIERAAAVAGETTARGILERALMEIRR